MATLVRPASVRLFRAFRDEQTDPARFYGALAADSVGAARTVRRPRRRAGARRRRRARATSATRSGPPGRRYFALDADVGELSGLGDHRRRARSSAAGMQLPFARRRLRRLLLLQRPRARARPVEDGRRDGPGHQARRHRLPLLHGLVGPVGRPRDGAVALPRRPLARRGVRPQARPPSRRTCTASRCSASPCATGSRWARRADRRRRASTSLPRYHPRWSLVAAARARAARGRDLEPGHRAAEAVTDAAADRAIRLALRWSPCCWRSSPSRSSRPRACSSPTPSSTWRRPGRRSWRGPAPVGRRSGAFGQVQNQAYGYLLPDGAVLLARRRRRRCRRGWSSGCGGRCCWSSRSWASCKLCPALGIGPTWRASLAGLAYALSPRMLTDARPDLDRGLADRAGALGPAAAGDRLAARVAAPAAARCRRWRWPCVGGVNAAATFAVIPLGRALAADPAPRPATPGADALVAGVRRCSATLWWLVPLLLLGPLQPAVPRLHRDRRRHDRPDRRSSTPCAARRTGCRTSTRSWRAGNDLISHADARS